MPEKTQSIKNKTSNEFSPVILDIDPENKNIKKLILEKIKNQLKEDPDYNGSTLVLGGQK